MVSSEFEGDVEADLVLMNELLVAARSLAVDGLATAQVVAD
jgi:hypothetical protein